MAPAFPACAAHTLQDHHYQELITQSGIDPAIVASRGYRSVTAQEAAALGFKPYQALAGLLMPQWTLAGVQVGYLLKPDRPRTKPNGTPQKYEAIEGQPAHLDIHPGAQPLLRDPSVPIDFTEGNKKSDANWSRDRLCVSLRGVNMFLRGRMVVPDLDEIALKGRRCRIIFDSDVTRKPSVAEALLRFAAALHRRGAVVEIVYLPEPDGGGKTGLDDWYVAGHTPDDLDALAQPWNGTGPGVWLRGSGEEDADTLRRERDAARADVSALAQAIDHPEMTLAKLRTAVAVGSLTLAKHRRGEVDDAGNVVLSAAEIAHDYRPKPAPEERLAPTNVDGSRPRLPRGNVKPLMVDAVRCGLIAARPIPVDRSHATTGATWRDTAWVVEPVPSLAAALNPWATYRPAEPKQRKPRTAAPPCPHCGEVHPIKRVDYCLGCGAQVGEPTIIPPATAAETGDNLSPNRYGGEGDPVSTGDNVSPLPPAEPAWLADAPDFSHEYAEFDDPGQRRLAPLAEHSPDPWRTPAASQAAPLPGFERPAQSFHFSAD